MLHPDLTIGGKKPAGEQALKPLFLRDCFSCGIGDLWLHMEYSRDRTAVIG